MRAPSVPANEQYRLVMDCRQSGLSDHQWCMLNEIKPGTFYNWVQRLRQRGVTNIAPPAGRNTYEPTPKQEVVRIDLQGNTEPVPVYEPRQPALLTDNQPADLVVTIELIINGNQIRITNAADPALLLRVIQILKGLPC